MMGQAIGEVLAFGVGVALSPLAIVAVVVMLVAPGGAWRAWAFAGGWVLSLALVSTLVLLLADGADASADGAARWVSVVKIVIGLLLVLFAVRQWRGRGEADTEAPGWMRKLDNVTAARAAGLAVLFNLVKPKNLLLAMGAGVAVARVGASAAGQASAIGVFVVLGTAGLGIPLAIHMLMRNRGRDLLVGLRDWMVRENAVIIIVLCLAIAAKLLGDAVIALSS
jgi:threonine/homoserine/homoserine lactone efflux protein